MKVLVIYTHPNPKSFNHAILETVLKGLKESKHEVKEKDLYKLDIKNTLDKKDLETLLGGDTPKDIKTEQEDISWAEALIFIYPTWWYDRPALLKGWIDRVWSNNFAYEYVDKKAKGLLTHNKALVITTLGSSEEDFDNLRPGDKEAIKIPMVHGTLNFCGIKNVDFKPFYGFVDNTEKERKAILEEIYLLAKDF